MEFGLPTRSATQDANQGVVNPPAVRQVVGQQQTVRQKQSSLLDGVVAENRLGSVLESFLDKKTESINEQRAISAAARQGRGEAINEVDKVKQNTGWEKFVFGENVEYRAAQQRAVQNKVQATYIEDAHNVANSAGDSPEQYLEKMTQRNSAILEGYANDPETRNLVGAALATSTSKLVGAHYKEHYAYNQLQQQETTRTQIQQTFDMFNVEKSQKLTTEAMQQSQANIVSFVNGAGKPTGMTTAAYDALMLDQVMVNTREGNLGAMKAYEASGKMDKFNGKQRAAWDKSVATYDTKYKRQVDTIIADQEYALLNALTEDEVLEAYRGGEERIGQVVAKSSGSEYSDLINSKAGVSSLKNSLTYKRRIADAQDKASSKAAELRVKQETSDAYTSEYFTANPERRAQIEADFPVPEAKKREFMDAYLLESSEKFLGKENPTIEEFGKGLLSNPKMQDYVMHQLKTNPTQSNMVSTIVTNTLEGTDRMYDEETGAPNEYGMSALSMMQKFSKDPNFDKMIGSRERALEWHARAQQMKAGRTRDYSDKFSVQYNANVGNKDAAAASMTNILPKGVSKQDWMKGQMSSMMGIPNASPASVTQALADFSQNMVALSWDKTAAMTLLQQTIKADAIVVRGSVIHGGSKLETALGEPLEPFLDKLDRTGYMQTVYKRLNGLDKTWDPKTGKDVHNASYDMSDDGEYLIVDSPTAASPVYVPMRELRELNVQAQRKAAVNTALKERAIKNHIQAQIYNPMNKG